MLEIERIGLWAISMFKPRRTFVTLPENPSGIGKDDQATLVDITDFLQSVRLPGYSPNILSGSLDLVFVSATESDLKTFIP